MGDGPRETDELVCLSALRAGRAAFYRALCDRAAEAAPDKRRDRDGGLLRDYVALLRSDGAGQIAEFFYLIEELGLKDAERFREFLVEHNASMRGYLADPERMRALGLTPQRVEAALFSDEQMSFIKLVSPPGQIYLDQSALGRLLAEAMAPESCRRVAIALAEGGLLLRHQVGHVLISSDGTLESLYRQHLRSVVAAIRG
ncbi:MAG: hypothetical protein AAF183_15620 [Pseudomonadota bacterium]